MVFRPNIDTLDRSSVLRYRAPYEIQEVLQITQKYKERSEQRKLASISPFRKELIGFQDATPSQEIWLQD